MGGLKVGEVIEELKSVNEKGHTTKEQDESRDDSTAASSAAVAAAKTNLAARMETPDAEGRPSAEA